MDKKRNVGIWLAALLLAGGFFLLGFNRWFDAGARDAKQGAKAAKLECLPRGHVNLAQHFHPHLTIVIDGMAQTIPASVGVAPSCMSELHMHDTSGKIHAESVLAAKTFTLGQFFEIWGKDFSRDRIFDHVVDDTHEIIFTVDGVPNGEFENLVLRDDQKIVIEYKRKGD